MSFDSLVHAPSHRRRMFCNRTLNLRQVAAIGYDMDYTLIHYKTAEWERRAYKIAQAKLAAQSWPTEGLHFVPDLMVRGLIIDTERGNFIKVNSFGYVKHAYHGTLPLALDEQRKLYSGSVISLSDKRFVFMNTLFSLSEACLYAQLVDQLDDGRMPVAMGYQDLYRRVRASIDEAHVEGQLKREIVAEPERFVDLDEDMPLALLDQYHAGKKILLITNNEWSYTAPMMAYVFDRFLPKPMKWQDLFAVAIVGARKPGFFSQRAPLFEVVTDDGLLRSVTRASAIHLRPGVVYQGGDAMLVETALGIAGDEILYVGDHIYGDVNVSKQVLRWRTALVLRELEDELDALEVFHEQQQQLTALMEEKQRLEFIQSNLRLAVQRARVGYGPQSQGLGAAGAQETSVLRARLHKLDDAVRPLAEGASKLSNQRWGPLMRAGNDKSHLARQIERYADIYTSRVSNFLWQTPYGYMRSLRGSLPHDPTTGPGTESATRGP